MSFYGVLRTSSVFCCPPERLLKRKSMVCYQIGWLGGVVCVLASGVAVVGLATYLLRRVVEDLSNSTEWRAYLVRGFRVLPGLTLMVIGCGFLWTTINHITSLRLP